MAAHLLIAESDPALCRSYRTFLRSVGFEVETAADGIECLDRLREDHPDALIVDVDLAWGGGDGVMARLADGEAPRPRAVIALGSHNPEVLAALLGLPATNCLEKPAHVSSLMVRLATLLCAATPAPPVAMTG